MEALNLINDMIRYFPQDRPKKESILEHRYFSVNLETAPSLA